MEDILKSIVKKYNSFASNTRPDNYEKVDYYNRFADLIEDEMVEHIEYFSDEYYEDYDSGEIEATLLDRFKEREDEVDAQWDSMFPEGDEDDSITDWLTDDN